MWCRTARQVVASILLVGVRTATGAELVDEQRRIVLILAPPCGGAGTHSPEIVKALDIPHLDAGHILRDAAAQQTPLGLEAKKRMDAGEFVTDDIVNSIMADRLTQPDCARGVLLDGYPRDVNQSKLLDASLAANGEAVTDVVLIDVPKRGLQECIVGRWGAPNGNSYNSNFIGGRRPKSLPPGVEPACDPADLKHCNMFDDETGEPLTRRSDDTLETLDTRVEFYHRKTEPLLPRYKQVLIEVNGDRPIPEVWEDIARGLGVDPSLGLGAVRGGRTEGRLTLLALGMLALVVGLPVALRTRSRGARGDDSSDPLDYRSFSPAAGPMVRILPQ